MNKVINGKGYNTETARELAIYENGYPRNDFKFYEETLYIKKTGEYFLYGEGGGNSKYGEWHGNSGGPGEAITPLTLKEAKEWAEQLDGDEYEKIFGAVEEETDKAVNEPQQQISVILPLSVLEALRKRKDKSGINVSSLIIKALRDAGYN